MCGVCVRESALQSVRSEAFQADGFHHSLLHGAGPRARWAPKAPNVIIAFDKNFGKPQTSPLRHRKCGASLPSSAASRPAAVWTLRLRDAQSHQYKGRGEAGRGKADQGLCFGMACLRRIDVLSFSTCLVLQVPRLATHSFILFMLSVCSVKL